MATLALTTDEILRGLCMVAGVDRDPGELDITTQEDFRQMIRGGMRDFYESAIDSNGNAHTWRFREREFNFAPEVNYSTGTVTIADGTVTLAGGTWPAHAADCVLSVDGQRVFVTSRVSNSVLTIDNTALAAAALSTYVLYHYRTEIATDFGDFISGLVYRYAGRSSVVSPITNTELRLRFGANFSVGCVKNYNVEPNATVDSGATTWKIAFWPAFAAESYVKGTYRAQPLDNLDDADLTTDSEFTQIEVAHAGTLKAAIMAACEMWYMEKPGIHTQNYQRLLAASIKHDLATAGPVEVDPNSGIDPRRLSLLYHTPEYL
jgi:hypothetical protein